MYPKPGEADELKVASNCREDMLMPKAFVLFFPTNNLTQSKKHETREFLGQSSGISL